MPVIKNGFIARSVKAALRNKTQFFADTMTIAGDVQAPVDDVEFYAHRVLINVKNFHDELGPNDSGVTAKTVLFTIDEQLQQGGWVIGQDRVDIDVLNSDGTRPYFAFSDELVSIKMDVGSLTKTLNPNSVIDLQTNQSIQIAGVVEVHGASSHANLNTGTKLTVLEEPLVRLLGKA